MKTEKILEKIEKLDKIKIDYRELTDFIYSLDLTHEQMELLADHENRWVKDGLAGNPKLTEEIMIKLANDEDEGVRYELVYNENLTEKIKTLIASDENEEVRYDAFKKLKFLKKEDLESAYDLINNSKHISRENFEETFDFIINKFPKLSKLAKMFKTIILKGKKDLK